MSKDFKSAVQPSDVLLTSVFIFKVLKVFKWDMGDTIISVRLYMSTSNYRQTWRPN